MNTTCTHPTSYATDMTDAEWEIIAPHINQDPKIGSPRDVCMRCVMNALFYIDRTGCQWNLLPKDLPNYGTVYYYFRKWRDDGTFERLNPALRRMVRKRAGRDSEPSLAIVDSQSVKTTAVGGDVGFDAHKQVKGRKRHILVDILGLLLVVVVTNASIQDTNSAAMIATRVQGKLPRIRKIIADQGYKQQFIAWFFTTLQWMVEIVQRNPHIKGFDVLPKRWIVERTFAGFGLYRRLSKDYEYYTMSSEAMIYLASIRLMVKRCANRRDYKLKS
ncbi:MAG: IS5 family transposase [Pseudomonadota bacterium]|nr:IS5 family transposase [Pseudomonadota bacterium]